MIELHELEKYQQGGQIFRPGAIQDVSPGLAPRVFQTAPLEVGGLNVQPVFAGISSAVQRDQLGLQRERLEETKKQAKFQRDESIYKSIKELGKTMGSVIKKGTDPSTGLYVGVYGDDIMALQEKQKSIMEGATNAMINGGDNGYSQAQQILMRGQQEMFGGVNEKIAIGNSSWLNQSASLLSGETSPGAGMMVDKVGLAEALSGAEEWLRIPENKYKDINVYLREQGKEGGLRSYTYNRKDVQSLEDEIINAGAAGQIGDRINEVFGGDPKTSDSLDKLKDTGSWDIDDIKNLYTSNSSLKAYLYEKGYITDQEVTDYITNRVKNKGIMSTTDQIKLAEADRDMNQLVEYTDPTTGQVYQLSPEQLRDVQIKQAEANIEAEKKTTIANAEGKNKVRGTNNKTTIEYKGGKKADITKSSVDSFMKNTGASEAVANKVSERIAQSKANGTFEQDKEGILEYLKQNVIPENANIVDINSLSEGIDISEGSKGENKVPTSNPSAISPNFKTSRADVGLRNNNPGNIRPTSSQLSGAIELDNGNLELSDGRIAVPDTTQPGEYFIQGKDIDDGLDLARKDLDAKIQGNSGAMKSSTVTKKGEQLESYMRNKYPDKDLNNYLDFATVEDLINVRTPRSKFGGDNTDASVEGLIKSAESAVPRGTLLKDLTPIQIDALNEAIIGHESPDSRAILNGRKEAIKNIVSSGELGDILQLEDKLQNVRKQGDDYYIDYLDQDGERKTLQIDTENPKQVADKVARDMRINIQDLDQNETVINELKPRTELLDKYSKALGLEVPKDTNSTQEVLGETEINTEPKVKSYITKNRLPEDSFTLAKQLVEGNINSGPIVLDDEINELSKLMAERDNYIYLRDKFLTREGSWAKNQVGAHNKNIIDTDNKIDDIVKGLDKNEILFQDSLNSPEMESVISDVSEVVAVEEGKFLNDIRKNKKSTPNGDESFGEIAGIKVYMFVRDGVSYYSLKSDRSSGTKSSLDNLVKLISKEVLRQELKK